MPSNTDLTILIPCKNEAESLAQVLEDLTRIAPQAEVVVVDDGSTDNSARVGNDHGAKVVSHRYSMGNGAAIKTGLRHAAGNVIVCMDADGQHDPQFIDDLLEGIEEGFDMVVGARQPAGQANIGRSLANRFYNWLAGLMVGHTVKDLTSGMRVFRKNQALDFIHLLPNGFSYPTTLTMAFFRAGYSIKYVPITVSPRIGQSHISPIKDGIRFFIIIFKIGTLYSPLKVFFPISVGFFVLGTIYYLFTYITLGRFTNMGALLFLSSAMTFMMGLVSEQITALMYQSTRRD